MCARYWRCCRTIGSVSRRSHSHAQREYAQGDILIEKLPDRRKLGRAHHIAADPDGLVVLGRGEKSGHRHVVHGDANLYRLQRQERPGVPDELYVGHLVVKGPQAAQLRHEEHAPIDLPPGIYRVRRQRVFTARMRSELVRD